MANKKVSKATDAVKEVVTNAVAASIDPSAPVKTTADVKSDFKDAVVQAATEAAITGDKETAKEEVVTAAKAGLLQLLKNAIMRVVFRK